MTLSLRRERVRTALFVSGLAVRSGLWLCALSFALRILPLPALLHWITVRERPQTEPCWPHVDRSVDVVGRLCQLRIFRLRFFPRACLRQSLVLYRVLRRMGHPVVIHFGVLKEGLHLHGHSWVTLHGRPLGERGPVSAFATIYSFPFSSHSAENVNGATVGR